MNHQTIITILATLSLPMGASAATIAYVDKDGNQTSWRTTSVTKTLDPDGDNVYGTAGYVGYAMRKNPGTGDAPNTNPLTYTSTNFETFSSIPSYLTLTSLSQNFVAAGFGYALVDNPTLAPGASVADIESGFGGINGAQSGNFMTLTLNAGVPANGLRIGVIATSLTGDDDSLNNLTLTQTAGSGSSTASATLAGTDGNFSFYFFDITGGTQNDVFTLSGAKPNVGNNNVIYHGISVDVIPEPSSALLCVLGGLLLITRRRR